MGSFDVQNSPLFQICRRLRPLQVCRHRMYIQYTGCDLFWDTLALLVEIIKAAPEKDIFERADQSLKSVVGIGFDDLNMLDEHHQT